MPAPYTVTSTEVTGAAAAATTVTLAAAAGVRRAVEAITVSCSGAAVTTPITLTVTDGATVVWSTDLALSIGVPVSPLPFALMGTAGNALVVATTAGPASCVVKVNVEYFDFVPNDIPTA